MNREPQHVYKFMATFVEGGIFQGRRTVVSGEREAAPSCTRDDVAAHVASSHRGELVQIVVERVA